MKNKLLMIAPSVSPFFISEKHLRLSKFRNLLTKHDFLFVIKNLNSCNRVESCLRRVTIDHLKYLHVLIESWDHDTLLWVQCSLILEYFVSLWPFKVKLHCSLHVFCSFIRFLYVLPVPSLYLLLHRNFHSKTLWNFSGYDGFHIVWSFQRIFDFFIKT